MTRRGLARVIGARAALGLATAVACIAVLGAPGPVQACSGAAPVLADELLHHPGSIAVVRVLGRSGRGERVRSVTLGVEELLRGSMNPVVRLERPFGAIGVCHDLFTGGILRTRMLVAFAVHRDDQGLVLTPAWDVTKDGHLQAIYDRVVPWATLAEAREALARTAPDLPALRHFSEPDPLPVVETLAVGVGVLGVAMAIGRRRHRLGV